MPGFASNILLEAILKRFPPEKAKRIRRIIYTILWAPIVLIALGFIATFIMQQIGKNKP